MSRCIQWLSAGNQVDERAAKKLVKALTASKKFSIRELLGRLDRRLLFADGHGQA
jgi:hypothetical protein